MFYCIGDGNRDEVWTSADVISSLQTSLFCFFGATLFVSFAVSRIRGRGRDLFFIIVLPFSRCLAGVIGEKLSVGREETMICPWRMTVSGEGITGGSRFDDDACMRCWKNNNAFMLVANKHKRERGKVMETLSPSGQAHHKRG